jgi:hypothetical protein
VGRTARLDARNLQRAREFRRQAIFTNSGVERGPMFVVSGRFFSHLPQRTRTGASGVVPVKYRLRRGGQVCLGCLEKLRDLQAPQCLAILHGVIRGAREFVLLLRASRREECTRQHAPAHHHAFRSRASRALRRGRPLQERAHLRPVARTGRSPTCARTPKAPTARRRASGGRAGPRINCSDDSPRKHLPGGL